jgi:hypothetical protein
MLVDKLIVLGSFNRFFSLALLMEVVLLKNLKHIARRAFWEVEIIVKFNNDFPFVMS